MSNGEKVGAPKFEIVDPATISIKDVPFDRPWDWLAAGWRDLWTVPGISLSYGALATVYGFLLTLGLSAANLESLMPVLAGGFLLIGPLLAVGLYEKSRVLSHGGKPELSGTISAATSSAFRLGLLSAFLLFLYLVWMRIAFMLLALFLGTQGLPPAREFMPCRASVHAQWPGPPDRRDRSRRCSGGSGLRSHGDFDPASDGPPHRRPDRDVEELRGSPPQSEAHGVVGRPYCRLHRARHGHAWRRPDRGVPTARPCDVARLPRPRRRIGRVDATCILAELFSLRGVGHPGCSHFSLVSVSNPSLARSS